MSTASRWLEFTLEDLQVAEMAEKEGIHNQTCFHAQQAAEKALKSFLVAKSGSAPKSHILSQLVGACAAIEKGFQAFEADCLDLDGYYIPTRFPDALAGSLP